MTLVLFRFQATLPFQEEGSRQSYRLRGLSRQCCSKNNSPGFSKDGRSQDTAPSAPAEAPAPAPAPAPVPTEAAELPRTSRVKKFHVGIPGWKKAAASVTMITSDDVSHLQMAFCPCVANLAFLRQASTTADPDIDPQYYSPH